MKKGSSEAQRKKFRIGFWSGPAGGKRKGPMATAWVEKKRNQKKAGGGNHPNSNESAWNANTSRCGKGKKGFSLGRAKRHVSRRKKSGREFWGTRNSLKYRLRTNEKGC